MKRVAIFASGLLALSIVSYASAVVGYQVGGPQFAARFAPAEAAYTVIVLRALRRNEVESAQSLLETHLDSQIVEHSTFNPHVASWFDLVSRDTAASDKLMARVAAYRAEHPSSATPEEVRTTIDSHLASFQR